MFKVLSSLFLTIAVSASLIGFAGGREGDPKTGSTARAAAVAGVTVPPKVVPDLVLEPVKQQPASPVENKPAAPKPPAAPVENKPEAPILPPISDPRGLTYEMAVNQAYAQVVNGGAPVYQNPGDAAAGIAPVRWLSSGYIFVALASAEPQEAGGQQWYALKAGGYAPATHISPYTPSHFHGVEVNAQPDKPFAWLVKDEKPSTAPGAAPSKDLPVIKRYSIVTLLESKQVANWTWYRIGDKQWLPQYRLGIVAGSKRPDGVAPNEKWVEVNLTEQTLAAYEGDEMRFATLVSSGLPQWPTATGLYRIWGKVAMDDMEGRRGLPDYYNLEDVTWTMYFNKDTALHTAYWHDGFGFQHSHGCVNLSPMDSLWLFRWTTPAKATNNWTMSSDADPGTWVWVHY